jgi:hypothetical protein
MVSAPNPAPNPEEDPMKFLAAALAALALAGCGAKPSTPTAAPTTTTALAPTNTTTDGTLAARAACAAQNVAILQEFDNAEHARLLNEFGVALDKMGKHDQDYFLPSRPTVRGHITASRRIVERARRLVASCPMSSSPIADSAAIDSIEDTIDSLETFADQVYNLAR